MARSNPKFATAPAANADRDPLESFDAAARWRWASQHAAAIHRHREPDARRQIEIVLGVEWETEVARLDALAITDAERFERLAEFARALGIWEITLERVRFCAARTLESKERRARERS